MAVEPERKLTEQPKQSPTVIPSGFYEGSDPHSFANVAEQNRASSTELVDIQDRVAQFVTETIQQPGEIDEATRKRLQMERARAICLNPDIPDPIAWEQVKPLIQESHTDLMLDHDFDPLDMSPIARKSALTHSYFGRRRAYILALNGLKGNPSKDAEKAKYAQMLRIYKDTYYRDVWPDTQGPLATVRVYLPDPKPVSRGRKLSHKSL